MTTVKRKSKQLGQILIELGLITPEQIDTASTALLPEALARRYRALPIGDRDGKLLVAMSDPANVYALDDIRTITGRDVQPVVATSADVEAAIQKYAGLDSHVEQLAAEAAEGSEGEEHDLEAALEDAPIVKLVNAIMTQRS